MTSSASGGGAVRVASAAFLWTTLICAITCFALVTWFRPTNWYSTDQDLANVRNNMTLVFPRDVPVLFGVALRLLTLSWWNICMQTETLKNGTVVRKRLGADAPLWSGSTAFPVSLQWGGIMFTILSVAGLQYLSHLNARDGKAGHMWTGVAAGWSGFKRNVSVGSKVRRVAHYQLPPYGLWSKLLGGLNVMDLLFLFTWFGIIIMYLYYYIARKFDSNAASFTPAPAPGPAAPSLDSLLKSAADPLVPINITAVVTAATAKGAADALAKVDISPAFGMKRLDQVGKSIGETSRMTIMLLFFPISRSSFLQWVFGSDFHTLIKYHRWMGWTNFWMLLSHSTLYMIQWGSLGNFAEELGGESVRSRRNICGLVAQMAAICIAITSMTVFRKNFYKVFLWVHINGFIVYILFALMHYKNLINWIAPLLIVYAMDRAFRYWQLASNWTRIGGADVSMDGNILTIVLKWAKARGAIKPGQHIYLRVPAVSALEAHPFSVADIAEEGHEARVTVHLRVAGAWTRAIVEKLQAQGSLKVQVEGPYDIKLDHIETTPVTVVIAGGMGVTPLLGWLRSLLRSNLDTHSRVHFLWAARSLSEIKLMGADLFAASTAAHSGNGLDKIGNKVHDSDHGSGSGSPHSRDSGSWLETTLHYTGFEHENDAVSTKVDVGVNAVVSLSLEGGNVGDADKQHALSVAPFRNPVMYFMCTLLSFFGAWAGLLAASYYDAYYLRTEAAGPNYLSVGVLQYLFVALGGIVPTFVFLALLNLLTPRQTSSAAFKHVPNYINSPLVVRPGYVLTNGADAGNAGMIHLVRGRPNVRSYLKRVMEENQGQSEINVLVGGPEAMYDAVKLCVAEMQHESSGVMLSCKRIAHHA